MYDRGGQVLRTGGVGYVTCVRQQIMQPGETLNVSINGSVRMEMLRERDALRLHAHMAVFMTPIRWLWSGWPQYIKDGPTGGTAPPTVAVTDSSGFGIGDSTSVTIQQFWKDAVLRVYNEWYKWPEDADATTLPLKAVNLPHSWTRCRADADPDDAADREVDGTVVGAVSTLQIKDLARKQAQFRSAVSREVLSFERYQPLLREAWGADGSREVDQVPVKIHESSVGVDPRSFPAQNDSGLGQWASIYDFNVDDGFKVTAPEHVIITYMMLVRLAPITNEMHPLANDRLTWEEQVGDPMILANTEPQQVEIRDVIADGTATSLGYQPAGWQWRVGNNILDRRVTERKSFPYYEEPTTAAEARDATRRLDAFRSQSLRDYIMDLYISEKSYSAIPDAMASLFAGSEGGKSAKGPFPGIAGKVR